MDVSELVLGLVALASVTSWVAMWRSDSFKLTGNKIELLSMTTIWIAVVVILVWALWP